MDFNDVYESYDSEIIHLSNSDIYMFANRSYSDIIRDYVTVARQYVNDGYAISLERFLNSLMEQSDTDCEFCEYRESDSDVDELETERDELRNTVDDVIDLLKKYDLRFSRKFRLSRLDIEPLMKELHRIVDEFE